MIDSVTPYATIQASANLTMIRMAVSRSNNTSLQEVRRSVVEAAAAAEGCDTGEIEGRAVTSGGDIKIDSRIAEVVIARVETALGGDKLARASDLEPEQITSVATLSRLLHSRISEPGSDG